MKRVLSIALAFFIAVSLTACAGQGSEQAVQDSVSQQTSSAESVQQDQSESKSESSVQQSSAEVSKEESSKEESSEQESSQEHSEEESKQQQSKQESKPEQQQSKQESKPETAAVQTKTSSKSYVPVSAISLSASSLKLYKGSSYVLSATIYPADATNLQFDWVWCTDGIISISPDGTITANEVGRTEVKAVTSNEREAVCTIEVVEKPAYTAPQPQLQPQPEYQPTDPVNPDPPVYYPVPEPTGSYVDPSWFDDAVFVGDSVSVKLQYYADNGSLGNASFLCAVSLGYNNALWDINRRGNVHPLLNGKKVTVDEGVRLIGKKKVFIMLGMNDIGMGVDFAINGMMKLTDRILQKTPDAQIYIQSVTPLIKGISRRDKLNNTNVALYNERARQVCEERGFVFVNVAEAISDGQGNLIYSYCGDPGYMGLHFSNAGCEKWVEYLRSHVA